MTFPFYAIREHQFGFDLIRINSETEKQYRASEWRWGQWGDDRRVPKDAVRASFAKFEDAQAAFKMCQDALGEMKAARRAAFDAYRARISKALGVSQ